MPSTEELVDRHGEDVVYKAFWLQKHIYEQGLEGIDFSGAAESKMQQIGPALVHKAINDEFTTDV